MTPTPQPAETFELLTAQHGQLTFALIKTGAVARGHERDIRMAILGANLTEVKSKSSAFAGAEYGFDDALLKELYAEHEGLPYYDGLMASVQSPVMAMVIGSYPGARDTVDQFRYLLGPTDPVRARELHPESIRARFGGDAMPDNAMHGSDSAASAERELRLFFPELFPVEA